MSVSPAVAIAGSQTITTDLASDFPAPINASKGQDDHSNRNGDKMPIRQRQRD